jgi:hypothetical protein
MTWIVYQERMKFLQQTLAAAPSCDFQDRHNLGIRPIADEARTRPRRGQDKASSRFYSVVHKTGRGQLMTRRRKHLFVRENIVCQ